MEIPARELNVIRFGLFEADLRRRVLTREGLRVKLQNQPFEILALLLQRPGEIVSREEIQQKLWPADTYVAFEDGLNTAIKKLRLALSDSANNPRFLETVPRRGYRFLAPVTFSLSGSMAQVPDAGPGSSESANATVDSIEEASPATTERELEPARRVALQKYWGFLAGAVGAALLFATALLIWHKSAAPSSAPDSSLLSSVSARSRPGHSPDPRAREEFQQARNDWKLRTAEALTKAVDHYNVAIELDPNYAEAYAGLANCYVVMPLLSGVASDDAYGKARQAASKAVALGESVAQAHLAVAEVRLYADWDFPAAEAEFRRAIELETNDAQAHQWYAEYLSLMSRHPEAIDEIQAALRLDPSSMIIHHQAGQILRAARKYPEALNEFRRALMIQPGFGPTYAAMALVYRAQGAYVESAEVRRNANIYWDPGGTAVKDSKWLADAYKRGGKRAFFQAELAFHEKHPGPDYDAAKIYGLLGERERTLHWLRQALTSRRPEILNVQNDPEFDAFRADPDFEEIVKEIKFPSPIPRN